jgi:hypothetical protein
MTTTSPDFLFSSPEADFGTGLYFGAHMTATDLDAEILSRLEPSRLKDFSALNQTAWFGYRFASPGHRLMYFLHCYRDSYTRTKKMLGKRFLSPAWLKDNPLLHMEKTAFTSLVRAMAEADMHGIPYEFYCDSLQAQHLRGIAHAPLSPNQMYGKRFVISAIDLWVERNISGIYTAKCAQLKASSYESHPIQEAYMDFLCEAVRSKGNKSFYLARLMFDIGHLTEERAVAEFGVDAFTRAFDFKS